MVTAWRALAASRRRFDAAASAIACVWHLVLPARCGSIGLEHVWHRASALFSLHRLDTVALCHTRRHPAGRAPRFVGPVCAIVGPSPPGGSTMRAPLKGALKK